MLDSSGLLPWYAHDAGSLLYFRRPTLLPQGRNRASVNGEGLDEVPFNNNVFPWHTTTLGLDGRVSFQLSAMMFQCVLTIQ
jgi:hypothetical protein